MIMPSKADSFEVLCLQIADDGRKDVLFGSSFDRARKALRPFMVGIKFPDVYFEFPLIGDPFLDVTVLYGDLEPGTRIDSEMAADMGPVLDWFADVRRDHQKISFGFELDAKEPTLPAPAIHFQPRAETEFVRPFCEIIGEPERADLYLDLGERMPSGWSLSFFGTFRGRPGFPLRVCGYLDNAEKEACAEDPRHLAQRFDQIGFSAYDSAMLDQVSTVMGASPGSVDFQFDVFPDGTIGGIFAVDVQFEIQQPEAVRAAYEDGPVAQVMNLIEHWGAADARWKLAADMAFARAVSVTLEDGTLGRYAFTVMPQWCKVRWKNTVLQPSKLYCLGHASLL